MKTFLTIVLFFSFALTSPLFAGSGHYHGPAPDQQAITSDEAAKHEAKIVEALAEDKKIDPSWVGLKENRVEQKTFDGRQEWVIVYNNSAIEDTSKQTLYFFLSLSGEYIAANYTGN